MIVDGISSNFALSQFKTARSQTSEALRIDPRRQVEALAQRLERARVHSDLMQVIDKVAAVEELVRDVPLRQSQRASTISRAELGLTGADLTATTLRSTEQINATPTSFSPFGPAWSGSSTAAATLDGVYDGSQGADTLTFRVRRGGVHGVDNLRVEVRLSDRTRVDNIRIRRNHPLDREYTLSNGLVFTLGAGALNRNETFTVDVSDAVGSVVDPNKPLDGVRNNNPNLQYGLAVTDGSFDVNGVGISVSATDTINDVLNRITNSTAGVSASFDAATETVLLTQNSLGSSYDIVLENDTSGFLAATKLSGAVSNLGGDGDVDTKLSALPAFAGVGSGSISVNGVQIDVDVDTDSLSDVLTRLNDVATGISATLHNGQRVLLTTTDPQEALELADGGTGFFRAIHVEEGIYRSVEGGRIPARARVRDIADATAQTATAFNRLFRNASSDPVRSQVLGEVRKEVGAALEHASELLGDDAARSLGMGLNLNLRDDVASFGEQERREFTRALEVDFRSLREMLLGPAPGETAGLLPNLISALQSTAFNLRGSSGPVGVFLDAYA